MIHFSTIKLVGDCEGDPSDNRLLIHNRDGSSTAGMMYSMCKWLLRSCFGLSVLFVSYWSRLMYVVLNQLWQLQHEFLSIKSTTVTQYDTGHLTRTCNVYVLFWLLSTHIFLTQQVSSHFFNQCHHNVQLAIPGCSMYHSPSSLYTSIDISSWINNSIIHSA